VWAKATDARSGGGDVRAVSSAGPIVRPPPECPVSWYLRKEWVDQEDGIDLVVIHYAWTPLGHHPDWSWGHEWRPMQDAGGDPRRRVKVLTLPREVSDDSRGANREYAFHHFFEVYQNGHPWSTDTFTEEIVCRDLEFVDEHGWITNICIHWAVDDWTAPVFSPMEDPRFPMDSEFTSLRYYGYNDKPRYHEAKFHMMQHIPLPHYWRSTMWGPRGARLLQQYHVGRTFPEHESTEFFLGPNGPTQPTGDCWVHEL
jgi:hypothetical protein